MRQKMIDEHGHVGVDAVKSSEVDPVTEVDRASERLIRKRLIQEVPRSRVLGEEGGEQCTQRDAGSPTEGNDLLWVVDPIDGTVNFVYGVPAYAVSIAATFKGVPIAAAVVDVANNLVYSAAVGEEATETAVPDFSTFDAHCAPQSRVVNVTSGVEEAPTASMAAGTTTMATALVATGFAYVAQRRARQAELLAQLLPEVRDIRRMGSAALDLCHVAAGRVDAYYEHGLGPWDHAAGVLIAARAGAIVQMPKLDIPSSEGVQVMATKPALWQPLSQRLSELVTGGVLAPITP
ncbi:inositol monophosphatase family protein [Corynebacterium anserum]